MTEVLKRRAAAARTTEVTYNGHQLYTFVGDSSRGEENQGFGAEWDAVSAIEVDG